MAARGTHRLSYNQAQFQGVKSTIDKLRKFGNIGENRIKIISENIATEIATDAKSNIQGYGELGAKIANSIIVEKVRSDNFSYTVRVGEQPLCAYVEFGTGAFVKIPKGWEDIAWHYKKENDGYMHAKPYLYPAYYKGRRQYKKDLKDSLNYLVERFNSNSI